jgi:hypothetical protein
MVAVMGPAVAMEKMELVGVKDSLTALRWVRFLEVRFCGPATREVSTIEVEIKLIAEYKWEWAPMFL